MAYGGGCNEMSNEKGSGVIVAAAAAAAVARVL